MKKTRKAKPDFSKPKPAKAVAAEPFESVEPPATLRSASFVESPIALADAAASVAATSSDAADSEITAAPDSASSASNGAFSADKSYANTPLIVIAGRPNVGKSTLFNNFVGKRMAIVDPTPGVTRDPVESNAFIAGKPVRLMDTGGFKLDRDIGTMEAVMDELVVERTLRQLKRADVILLVLEAGTITGEDEDFIAHLRPYWHKVVAAVNKCEGGKNEAVAWNYAQFGFEKLFFISAQHGDHVPELQKALVERLDFSRVVESDDPGTPIRIAILGKPNTGKSTLSNRLTHSERSIVSDYAGTTRDVVEGEFTYAGRKFEVVDTAGIRRKAKVKNDVEYYSVNRAIKTLDNCDVVFLMIDAQEGLAEQDKKICALAYERGRGIIFVLNKWDTQDQSRATLRKTVDYIKTMFGHMSYAPILPLSALKGEGIKDLLNTTMTLYGQLTRKLGTASLNEALKDWLFRYPPPASRAIHFKIRYMTQTSANPVAFVIFATSPDKVPESYVSYLKNRIREDLGFDQIPVALELKASRTRWEQRERNRDSAD